MSALLSSPRPEHARPETSRPDGASVGAAPTPLDAVIEWHRAVPGKGFRRRLAEEAGRALGLPSDLSGEIAAIVESVHEASLLIDDVNDRAGERRGRESAFARFGADKAMLAGLKLLADAQARAAALAPDEPCPGALAGALAAAVAEACEGQADDLDGDVGDWSAYERVCRGKTGALAALAVVLPAEAAGLHPSAVAAAREAVVLIGLAYQIRDDLADGDVALAHLEPPAPMRLTALRAEIARAIDRAPLPLRPAVARLARQLLA